MYKTSDKHTHQETGELLRRLPKDAERIIVCEEPTTAKRYWNTYDKELNHQEHKENNRRSRKAW